MLDAPAVRRRPCRRGTPAPCVRVRCLPCCSTTPSATSMIGLIDSAVASSALALPMRPPFFRLSSVSRAPNTRVRATRSRGERLDGVEVVAGGGALGAGEGDRAEAERDRAAVDDAHVEAVGATRAASSALCIVADRAPESVTTTMPVAPRSARRAVGLLEPARRRRGRRGQLRRRRAAGPELGGRQLLAVDELLVAEADAQRHDLDAPALGELVGQVAGAVGDDADRRYVLSSRVGHATVRRLPAVWRSGDDLGRVGRRRVGTERSSPACRRSSRDRGQAAPAAPAEVPVPPRQQHERPPRR